MQAIRKLFGKKGEGTEEATSEQKQEEDQSKSGKRLHPYDDVSVGNNSNGPEVTEQAQTSENLQAPKKRAPRQYEDVDVPGPEESDSKIAVR